VYADVQTLGSRPLLGERVREQPAGRVLTARRGAPALRAALLGAAGALLLGAIFLPLWGMTLVSVQYPEGLRMVVYPLRMTGDLREINMLNGYIGMAEISPAYFGELRIIVALFAVTAAVCVGAALLRRWWMPLLPLALLAGTGTYGLLRMHARLYQYGHDLDPRAPIEIAPFTPPMLGENQIAQFATYAYFSWGTALPLIAASLVAAAFWLDLRVRRRALP
jgi:hypothetical protein